jgi:hypothetical protein
VKNRFTANATPVGFVCLLFHPQSIYHARSFNIRLHLRRQQCRQSNVSEAFVEIEEIFWGVPLYFRFLLLNSFTTRFRTPFFVRGSVITFLFLCGKWRAAPLFGHSRFYQETGVSGFVY